MAQMCLVKDAMFPEGWAGTLRTPLRPSGGLMSSLLLTGFMGELSWGLLVPKPRVGVVGTDMEWGPMGELMTEKGGPMPLTGELSVLMGEGSCPGEPSEAPRPGPRDGCSEGAAMELRPVGEPRDEELTWVEKSQEPAVQAGAATRAGPAWVMPQTRTLQGPGEGGHPASRGPAQRGHLLFEASLTSQAVCG